MVAGPQGGLTNAAAIKSAEATRREYARQITNLETELRLQEEHLREMEEAWIHGVTRLAEALLPGAGPAEVEDVGHMTGALHLGERIAALAKKRYEYRARLNSIEEEKHFQNHAELIDPEQGRYTEEVRMAEILYKGLRHQRDRYEFEQFLWLFQRRKRRLEDPEPFDTFWRMVTLAEQRERRAMDVVRKRLMGGKLETLCNEYESLVEKSDFLAGELAKARQRYQDVVDLVTEHERLTTWLDRYDDICRESLQHDLASFLLEADLEALHAGVPEEHQMRVAQCHALAQKRDYYQQIQTYLRGEIARRKEARSKLSELVHAWAREPFALAETDTHEHLEKQPRLWRQETEDLLHHARHLAESIYHFNQIKHYNALLLDRKPFLAVDIFILERGEPHPDEIISRRLIPQVSAYRLAQGEERINLERLRLRLSS